MHDEYLKQCNEDINLSRAMLLFCPVLVSYISLVWFVESLCSVHTLQREMVHTVGHAIRAPSSLLLSLSLSLFYPLSVFFAVTIFSFCLPPCTRCPFAPYFLGSVYNKGEQRRRKQIRCSLCKTAEGEDVC